MIRKIKVLPEGGHLSAMDWLVGRELEFSGELNLLFGPSATGKTSLLRSVLARSIIHPASDSVDPKSTSPVKVECDEPTEVLLYQARSDPWLSMLQGRVDRSNLL